MYNSRLPYSSKAALPGDANSTHISQNRLHGSLSPDMAPSGIGLADGNRSGDWKSVSVKPRPGSAPPTKSTQPLPIASFGPAGSQKQDHSLLQDDRSFQSSLHRNSEMSLGYTDLPSQSLDDEEIIVSEDSVLESSLVEVCRASMI